MLATSEGEFISHLADYGVKITRSGKDYSYLHPQKNKAIRGFKLGANYTKTEVLNGIAKLKNGADGYAVGTITTDKRVTVTTDGERTAERSVGDIQREMQQLDRTAEYARKGLDGERERDKERQQLLREEAQRKRTDGSSGNARDNAGRAAVQSGSKPDNKKRDNSFSK